MEPIVKAALIVQETPNSGSLAIPIKVLKNHLKEHELKIKEVGLQAIWIIGEELYKAKQKVIEYTKDKRAPGFIDWAKNIFGWNKGNIGRYIKAYQDNEKDIKKIWGHDKPHISNNSGENEWYTPEYIISAAKETMESIEIDPASCKEANKIVEADNYYTEENNGLENKWEGNVWLNPPYAQPLINDFAKKAKKEYEDGNIRNMCVLVNNATETEWFNTFIENATLICFLKSRVKFIDKNGEPSGAPLQGQAVIYYGKRKQAFIKNFTDKGFIVEVIK